MKANWSDLALFAAVARHGALAPAALETGQSSPTLSRRMTALERDLGQKLFHRGRRGFDLTAQGRALVQRTSEMENAAAQIADHNAGPQGAARVRISAGSWTIMRLCRDLPRYWSPKAVWSPEFLRFEVQQDLARREVDIGLRNARPIQPWLAGQRVMRVEFAGFACQSAPPPDTWIGPADANVPTPSARWVTRTHGSRISMRTNDAYIALSLALEGMGQIVLPTFIGLPQAELVQTTPVIPELSHDQWLVSHHEARFDPPIRAALNDLAAHLKTLTPKA